LPESVGAPRMIGLPRCTRKVCSLQVDRNAARAAEIIAAADALLVTAGAGIGVDSGLPDFRGREGFWRAYPALGKANVAFTEIASPAAFESWPLRAWGFYGHRLALYRRTLPHRGFALLKRWGESMEHGYFAFTSNVDGQFQIAGFDDARIVECHGSIHHLQCLQPCSDGIWPASDFEPVVDEQACMLRNAPPLCPDCGGLARPNVLMFGDWCWNGAREQLQSARLQKWLATVRSPAIVELGAGTAIPSVRDFGQWAIQKFGARLIRINPREAAVRGREHVGIDAGASAGLQAIDLALGHEAAGRAGPNHG